MAEWRAFERIEGPLGARRSDLLTALLAKTLVEVHAQEEIWPPLTLDDFLITYISPYEDYRDDSDTVPGDDEGG